MEKVITWRLHYREIYSKWNSTDRALPHQRVFGVKQTFCIKWHPDHTTHRILRTVCFVLQSSDGRDALPQPFSCSVDGVALKAAEPQHDARDEEHYNLQFHRQRGPVIKRLILIPFGFEALLYKELNVPNARTEPDPRRNVAFEEFRTREATEARL